MIDLNFLGIGSAFTPELGNNSSYYKENDNMILIDCGWDVYPKIRKFNLLDNINTLYIFCTHTHQDHCGSMGTLISWCSQVKAIKVYLVLPPDLEWIENLTNMLNTADVYLNEDYYILNNLENIFSKIVNVSFFEVEHCARIKSYAMKFYFNNNTFMVYSGDCANIQSVLKQTIDSNSYKFTRAYVDCNLESLSKISSIKPHELLADLETFIPINMRKYFYVMHYDSLKCIDAAKQCGFNTVASKLK